jgi:hypothetical protein
MATKEKTPAAYYWFGGFAGLLVLFMIIEGLFNAFNTFYGQNAAAAGAGWKILGIVCLAISGIIFWLSAKSNKGITTGSVILAGVFLVLALCAFAGFSFDIA